MRFTSEKGPDCQQTSENDMHFFLLWLCMTVMAVHCVYNKML